MKAFDELVKIAKEASVIGFEDYGTGWNDLTRDIRAYTSDTRDHQAAEICGIDVALHREPNITVTAEQLSNLPKIAVKAKRELAEYKEAREERLAEDIEYQKQRRIASLEAELRELKGEA